MKAFALVSILAAGLLCNAAHAQDALQPCNNTSMPDYDKRVGTIIDGAVGRPAQLQLTTLPSFEPESGVRLVGTDVYVVRLTSSLWAHARQRNGRMDFSKPKIATTVHHAPLSAELVQRIEQGYAKAIAGTKASDGTGLDGVSYRFSLSHAGCGEAWSPAEGSPNYRLVELLALLEKHANLSKPQDLKRSEESIAARLKTIDGH